MLLDVGTLAHVKTPRETATRAERSTMAKKLLLVDVDCGLDDAQALMIALAEPTVEILGITCCFGNTTVENVCRNVLHVLDVCERTKIPVFPGASSSLLGGVNPTFVHFGSDGLGDAGETANVGLEHLQKEHAVNAIIRIINEHVGEISLVATAPLTNLALAVKLDPELPKKLKNLYIMGGNLEGKGNTTVCAEFNFYLDPEAAQIVLNEFTCPTYIAALDFAYKHALSKEFFEKWINQDSVKANFMKRITTKTQLHDIGFVSYDAFAMAAAIDESIITEHLECGVHVDLRGEFSRGMMVLDVKDRLKKKHKAYLMKKCDLEKFENVMMSALQ
ncbi:hypothetical protein NDU88_006936 [Pleurodeles waltl]|uniref:Inosine/uridine-preferring nucleoside hydrolase domain-containing protein n=3 Tax=Pleurodeles waltl TaxID=8319 RepID=A0AAV7NUT8_PLEWA|nr:hypothetical protein NDU88_006936 [Pleurodeles waltl]